ncbi:GPW/gp25 family protein [Ancylobacter amanitiformis]|uniref:Phage baseplate assembly protein W n=1 Tax=Ancylobacter amanitiformis TaxID=217069 RepID=A0ABU0LQA2_9HYPH|nr:GPW/gp25 family protein [Ancylobacter amanitiformis]MDQ0510879.1 phage baseplate assembly protein W [Ancylobacter amanitiformis]
MASSSGISRVTGAVLTDFDHVVQSINVILTTPIGSRVMRREFGSEILDLIDRPMTDQVILAVYAAAATAIALWEPRFAVTSCRLIAASAEGTLELALTGTYYPRGHLGDFTPANDNASILVPLSRIAA